MTYPPRNNPGTSTNGFTPWREDSVILSLGAVDVSLRLRPISESSNGDLPDRFLYARIANECIRKIMTNN